ncbi:MAG: hypothetical protein DRH79_01975 [Candidatus Cloacimonadota bacterium]|nr:MAG: hypothetical protein DRH79_01975 [Candidatus Cloacimonadota bacterium]
MKKLLFVSTYKSPSVLRDLHILQNHFNCKELFFPNASRKFFFTIHSVIQILFRMLKADVCFVRFADFRAFLVVIFAKLFRKKSLIAIGGYEVANEPDFNYGALLTRSGGKRVKYILKNADIIIANSDFSRNEIKKLENIDVKVISHGIENTLSFEKTITRDDVIVTIGSLKKDIYKLKGVDTFARAVTQVGVKAIAIGEFDKQVYAELKSINPELELPGFLPQNEITAILKNAKVYCQLSYRESFGVALLEAMALGCIPVVTKNGALPEVVGDVGFYVEYGDVNKTADAISKALKSNNSEDVIDRVNNKFLLQYREEKLLNLLTEKKWI